MFFINPFIYAAGADFESIATVTVGSGGASDVTFSDIPSGFQHLQIRYVVRSTRASNTRDNMILRLGTTSIDTGSNYAYHFIQGLGASVGVGAAASAAYALLGFTTGSTATASVFGAGIVDILDYASTSKNKTTRALSGVDLNGSEFHGIDVSSGLWMNTAAIQSVRIYAFNANLAQHSTVALYGIKAP